MNQNNENDGVFYIGGIVVVIIMLGFLTKILKNVANELSQLFTAIGKMSLSFLGMAWQIAIVLGTLSLGVAAIWAAWYFTKKYYQMVKDGTEVKEQIENRFSELQRKLTAEFNELKIDSTREISWMRQELDDALKKSDVTPAPPNTINSENDSQTETSDENDDSSAHLSVDELEDQFEDQIQDTPKDISNPY